MPTTLSHVTIVLERARASKNIEYVRARKTQARHDDNGREKKDERGGEH